MQTDIKEQTKTKRDRHIKTPGKDRDRYDKDKVRYKRTEKDIKACRQTERNRGKQRDYIQSDR